MGQVADFFGPGIVHRLAAENRVHDVPAVQKRKSKRYAEILEQVGHATGKRAGKTIAWQSDEVTDLDKLLAVLTDEERAIMVMSYACGSVTPGNQ